MVNSRKPGANPLKYSQFLKKRITWLNTFGFPCKRGKVIRLKRPSPEPDPDQVQGETPRRTGAHDPILLARKKRGDDPGARGLPTLSPDLSTGVRIVAKRLLH